MCLFSLDTSATLFVLALWLLIIPYILLFVVQIRPGGPRNREELVHILIKHGADVNALV